MNVPVSDTHIQYVRACNTKVFNSIHNIEVIVKNEPPQVYTVVGTESQL